MLTPPDIANVTILQIIYSHTPVLDNSLASSILLGCPANWTRKLPPSPSLLCTSVSSEELCFNEFDCIKTSEDKTLSGPHSSHSSNTTC